MKIKYYKHTLISYDTTTKEETRIEFNNFRKKPTAAEMKNAKALDSISEEREIQIPSAVLLNLIAEEENRENNYYENLFKEDN